MRRRRGTVDGTPTNFRPDVNALRAIAVVGVIAFHFRLGPLRAGGFAGVDVFFVISGFLMTQIITGRLDQSRFTLGGFLEARTRRIIPAFVVLVLAVLLAVLLLLNPLELEAQSERAVWSLLFLSNVLYAKQGAYFVTPDQNWLLHTWSLSVEWQFYLLFPLLLVGLRKLHVSRAIEVGTFGLVAIGSFAAMLWSLGASGDSGTWNFYMLSSRAWEFLAGALVAYALPYTQLSGRMRTVGHYLGLATILVSFLVFHNTTPWPSGWTLLPVAGTAVVLVCRHGSPLWARIEPVRRIGLWSYSVYLWHWPIVAASIYFGKWSILERLIGVAVSFGLGAASYRLVEQRLTDLLWQRRGWPIRVGMPAFGALLLFAFVASATNGLEALRYGSDPARLARLRDYRTAHHDWFSSAYCDLARTPLGVLDECRHGNPKSDDVLVIGDSFAAQLSPRYHDLFAQAPFGISFVTHHSCVPITGTKYIEFNEPCDSWSEQVYRYALDHPYKRVVFTAFWPRYDQQHLCIEALPGCGTHLDPKLYDIALDEGYGRMATLWRRLREQGKEVIVLDVLPYPDHPGDPIRLYDKVAAGSLTDTLAMSKSAFAARHEVATRRLKAAAKSADANYVDPAGPLCPHDQCPIVLDGRPLYKDAYHLRNSMMKDARFAFLDRYILPSGAKQARAD